LARLTATRISSSQWDLETNASSILRQIVSERGACSASTLLTQIGSQSFQTGGAIFWALVLLIIELSLFVACVQ
jgi:hypothetical protein